MRLSTEFRTPTEKKISIRECQRIWNEINSLTPSQLLRLRKFAAWRIRGLYDLAAGREDLDLLHEAVIATADGRRPWRSFSLVDHLLSTMRSISSGWTKRGLLERGRPEEQERLGLRRRFADYAGGQGGPDQADKESEVQRMPLGEPSPENLASAKELFDNLRVSLAEDMTARQVLGMRVNGWTDKEILTVLGISLNEYLAAKKRVRRRLQRILAADNACQDRKRASGKVP